MTHGEGQNFIKQIADAYAAAEREPTLLDTIDRLKNASVADGERIARLETRLMDRATEMDALRSTIRSLEVERDDYGFRALEANDKADALLLAIRSVQATLSSAVEASVPKAEVQPSPPPADLPPYQPPVWTETDTIHQEVKDQGEPQPSEVKTEVVDPTTDTIESPKEDGHITTNTIPIGAASEPQPSPGPYFGKRYINVPGYVSHEDWIAGGGTDEDYFISLHRA